MPTISDPPPTRPSWTAITPAQLVELEERIRRELRSEMAARVQVVSASLRAPPPPSRAAQLLRSAPGTVRWGAFLTGVATLIGAMSPTIVAAIDVARLRAEMATIADERKKEADSLRAYKDEIQRVDDGQHARLNKLEEHAAKLREELDTLEKQLTKKRR